MHEGFNHIKRSEGKWQTEERNDVFKHRIHFKNPLHSLHSCFFQILILESRMLKRNACLCLSQTRHYIISIIFLFSLSQYGFWIFFNHLVTLLNYKFSSCKIEITGIINPIDNNSKIKELIIRKPSNINFENPNFLIIKKVLLEKCPYLNLREF